MSRYDPDQAKEEYDDFYSSSDFDTHPGEREIVRSIIGIVNLQRGDKVLDVPCGTGKYSGYFSKEGLNVTGVDISDVGIQIADRRFSTPEFVVGDATCLPIENKHFDAVFCHGLSLFNKRDISSCEPFINQAIDSMKAGGVLIWGKTTNLSDSDVGSRFDHSFQSLFDFFSGFEEVVQVKMYATVPHLGLLLRKKTLNKYITKGLIKVSKLTGFPIRAYCLIKTR